jgi:hypothetical protein
MSLVGEGRTEGPQEKYQGSNTAEQAKHGPSNEVTYEKRVAGKLVAKFAGGEQEAARVDLLLQDLFRPCDTANGKSRAVVVTTVLDRDEYEERVRTKGARPLINYVFPSAKAASTHFGYHWNAVLQALIRAKERGDEFAKVAGLQVAWLDEMPGLK